MVALAPPALPRLGDPFSAFAERLGLPFRTETVSGCIARHYVSELGMLTVLFNGGKSIALHVPYGQPVPRKGELASLTEQLAPAGGGCRLLIADGGWLLATDACLRPCLQALLGIV
jgi:hypothetical protein